MIDQGNTFTTTKRFSEEKETLGPGQYKIIEQKKKSVSFSKSSRNLFGMKNDTDLEHRFYIDPFLESKKKEFNISKVQTNPLPFGSQVARFTKL